MSESNDGIDPSRSADSCAPGNWSAPSAYAPVSEWARSKADTTRLYYRRAPHANYLVFAPPERAVLVDRIHRAINESKTWGEFRNRMPADEYETLFEEQFSLELDVVAEADDAQEPTDDAPFTCDCVPGFVDGDYPPWLAPEQDEYLPSDVLQEFATREHTFVNGSFWRFDNARTGPIIESLERLGYKVERRDDLLFW